MGFALLYRASGESMPKILILLAHVFGTSEGAGTAILTFLGGFHPQTESLWLTDMAHHHLAIAVIFIIAGHMYRTNFGIGHSMKEIMAAHNPLKVPPLAA
jgi:photosystem I P700 chlorophyll a apoprotein A2